MEEFYFLYAIALVWIIFATKQDLRTEEIANWLSFSLIVFVISYRAFYTVFTNDVMFLVYGIIGILLFAVLSYLFYYTKVFGGGDAKLLMGLGGIWPYQGFADYLYIGLGFVFLLFVAGAIYTIVYTLFLVRKNWDKFTGEFSKEFRKSRLWFYLAVLLVVVFEVTIWLTLGFNYLSVLILIFILLPLLYVYTKAVESSFMIVLKSPGELIEGDWLEGDVKIGKKTIKKSVHGLSREEIKILKKARKKVWVKGGVPFTPAFLIAFLIMLLVLRYSSGFFNYLG